MNSDEHKQKVKASFDMASEGYDCPSLRFFVDSAAYLVEMMKLKGDEALLDIATGTGNVAVKAAQVLKNGSVTGIDLSQKMLQRAVEKAEAMNLRNVTFKHCDVEHMGFDDHTFDAASCAFGLFFLPDMEKGLKCISAVLKPGGKLAVTGFAPSLMMPQREMFFSRIREYGINGPQLLWMKMDSPEKIKALLNNAGFGNVHIVSKQMGYFLKNSLEWWDVLWNSGHRGLVSQLSEADKQRFMDEHLREVESMVNDNGIWLEVEVLFATAIARKG